MPSYADSLNIGLLWRVNLLRCGKAQGSKLKAQGRKNKVKNWDADFHRFPHFAEGYDAAGT
jgi:hypothetical protein